MTPDLRLAELAERWAGARASERANAQSYLIELCEALGVERPGPAGSGYQFELPVRVVHADGTEATNFVDLYKQGCFLLEAKDEEPGRSNDLLLRRAFGQARGYVSHLPGALPPYLLVLDVARTLLVWDRWSGSYGGFNAARTIDLATLADRPDDVAFLKDVWSDPAARNPARRAEAVTREVAARLAELATSLEKRGEHPERVARFLMRAVFTMFAEDVGLLEGEPFREALEETGRRDPAQLAEALTRLWKAMDAGDFFGYRRLLRFNGHFFKDTEAVALSRGDVAILEAAARADWRDVEPSIFGTLLVRALDPDERHRLGAEFTPRAYVERLVRPTLEEPIRERWTLVQAEVLQLRERGRPQDLKKALDRLHDFHAWLRSLQVLDPACGSGNFLYVALDAMKRVELEVFREIEAITGQRELAVQEVDPSQFHGIEVKLWARELTELTLWIGYHQWWARTHGSVRPPQPVLEETGTFEHRDAVLAWDSVGDDPARARPDPTPRIAHPVTGELVPDPEARLRYEVYEGARPAEWPRADFIVGNPPYMGNKRMREAFGDGYVDALRAAYPDVPESADYVMYWWHRAAQEVATGRALRAGLITTNSITQTYNRAVISRALDAGAQLAWAIPTHPWVDEAGGAAVRVAMTVLAREPGRALRVEVDDDGRVVREVEAASLNADLTAHADVASAAGTPLLSNRGVASVGFWLVGEGFRLDAGEAQQLIAMESAHAEIVRPIINGRDLAKHPRGIFAVDFGLRDEDQARGFPVLYDLLRNRVKPLRDANNDRSAREKWWRFGRNREDLRAALTDIPRYIATPETSKHPVFQFVPSGTAAEHSVVCIALDDPYYLGVLSSAIHVTWALAAGGRLGIGNDPRYQKALCFDPFPFPEADPALRDRIAAVALHLDQHRKDALARGARVTMTGMYNVVARLRSGEPLTPAERHVHEAAACGVLRDLHDELDRLVAAAYGWPWPLGANDVLARLVALHDERVEEEQRGLVRWLRPDYQRARFAREAATPTVELRLDVAPEPQAVPEAEPWPTTAAEQIGALQALLARGPVSIDAAAARFKNARRDLVARHLETLAILGEARLAEGGVYHAVRQAA